jgi:ADP-ribose pyrophosphatase
MRICKGQLANQNKNSTPKFCEGKGDTMRKEHSISRQTIYSGRILKLHLDEVELPEGKTVSREVVEHGGGVAILASADGVNLLLVRQYRHPVGRELLELPAGKLEAGESPAACAMRELEEETGYRAKQVRQLGCFYPSPGYTSEALYLYAAQGLVPTAQHLDEDEMLSVVTLPISEALAACRDGRILDAKTALAIHLWLEERR